MTFNWPKRIKEASRKKENILKYWKAYLRCGVSHWATCLFFCIWNTSTSPFLGWQHSAYWALLFIEIPPIFPDSSQISCTLGDIPIITAHYYSLSPFTERILITAFIAFRLMLCCLCLTDSTTDQFLEGKDYALCLLISHIVFYK